MYEHLKAHQVPSLHALCEALGTPVVIRWTNFRMLSPGLLSTVPLNVRLCSYYGLQEAERSCKQKEWQDEGKQRVATYILFPVLSKY